jgi:hypothetical protein
MAILKATICIQRHARGFITRLKVKKVVEMQENFERLRLQEALDSMCAQVNVVAGGVCESPIKGAKNLLLSKEEHAALKI